MSKYNSRKAVVNGITFDSKKEAARYRELMLMLAAGKIRELKLQPEFTLQEAFKTKDGEPVRAVKYRADFSYMMDTESGVVSVVEDVKGYKTKDYEIKRKLMLGRGVKVVEI